MNSRFTSLPVTVLLLILAAFGMGGARLAVAGFTQAAVSSSHEERSELRRVSEQRTTHVVPLPPVYRTVSQGEHWLPDLFLCREWFQRPPPPLLLSLA